MNEAWRWWTWSVTDIQCCSRLRVRNTKFLTEWAQKEAMQWQNTPVSLLVNEGRFTLQRRSPPVMNFREILKFGWPRATLLSGGGLHYCQESLGGEHCTWMKKLTWMPTWRHFFWRGVLRKSSFLGYLKALDKKLDLRRILTWMRYFIVYSSSPAYHPLPQITMFGLKRLTDRCTSPP